MERSDTPAVSYLPRAILFCILQTAAEIPFFKPVGFWYAAGFIYIKIYQFRKYRITEIYIKSAHLLSPPLSFFGKFPDIPIKSTLFLKNNPTTYHRKHAVLEIYTNFKIYHSRNLIFFIWKHPLTVKLRNAPVTPCLSK